MGSVVEFVMSGGGPRPWDLQLTPLVELVWHPCGGWGVLSQSGQYSNFKTSIDEAAAVSCGLKV